MQLFAYGRPRITLYTHSTRNRPMALNHAIMTALLDDRLSGYELTKSFDTSLGFFWKASHQQIYKALRDLEKQGLLQSEDIPQAGKPDKVIYGLTDAGREALEEWVLGESRVTESKDDMFVKFYNLSPDNAAHLREELAERRQQDAARLALYQRIRQRNYAEPAALPVRRQGIYLALLAGIRHCETRLAWAEEADALLAAVTPAQSAAAR